jgi:hypothetical protein
MNEFQQVLVNFLMQDEDNELPAYLGNKSGVVKTNITGRVYVTLFNSAVMKVYNDRVPNIYHRWVMLGYDKHSKLIYVKKSWFAYNEKFEADVGEHAELHEWWNVDAIKVHGENIIPGLTVPDEDISVKIFSRPFYLSGWHLFSTRTVDLSSHVPASGARFVLIEINTSGVVSILDGTTVSDRGALNYSDIPIPSVDKHLLSIVRLYAGQTRVIKTRTDTDIIDPRWAGYYYASVSGDISYTPVDNNDWDCLADPGDVNDALDQLAARMVDVENMQGGGDASQITYYPLDNTDWDCLEDPGNVDGALDQLADRINNIEVSQGGDASQVTYTPADNNDWDCLADPGDVDDALDRLAARMIDVENMQGGGDKYPFEARLTLETSVPISTTDQLAKTHVYLTPYRGDQIAIYDGASTWTTLALSADLDLDISALGRQQAYTNDPAAGSNIELNMASTTGFRVGDKIKVSSSAGSEEATITVVHTGVHITVDVLALNHTTTNPLVIGKLPYDIFVYNNSGALAMEALAWTDGITRAIALASQNGVKVKTGVTTRRYVGTISTTLVIGQCEDSVKSRLVYNYYNQKIRRLFMGTNALNTFSVGSNVYVDMPDTTIGEGRVEFIIGIDENPVYLAWTCGGSSSVAGGIVLAGIGLDCCATVSPAWSNDEGGYAISASAGEQMFISFVYNRLPGIGLHYLQRLVYKYTSKNTTIDDRDSRNAVGQIIG